MYPHRIRLRGPWQCEPLVRQGDGPLPSPCRMTLPCRWAEGGLGDFAGAVRFRRGFGYPGQIDAFERVWLTLAGVVGQATISLNGQLLGQSSVPAFEFEITSLLQARNELIVEVAAGPDGGLAGEVALEVRRSAYLREVRLQATPTQVSAEGLVAGTAEGPLDLYLILDRSTAAYQKVDAGQRFHLAEPVAVSPGPHILRLDLVDAATVWYTLEQTIDLSPE